MSKDLDDFGGLKDMLDKFYSHVEQRLRDHPVLSQPIDLSKYDENLEF